MKAKAPKHLRLWTAGLSLSLIFGATSVASAEQSNSVRARPYIATDRTVTVNGLTVRLYFASADGQDARTVVYVPPVMLRAEEPQDPPGDARRLFPWTSIHEVNGQWILNLEAMWDLNRSETTVATIRDQIQAWDDAKLYDLQPGNINPLYAAQVWFEIEDDDGTIIRSTGNDDQDFLESGARPVRFAFGSAREAQRIAEGLRRPDAPLRVMFRFAFEGDLVEPCTATLDTASLQDEGRFGSLFGEADGAVERRVAIEAARELVDTVAVNTRCSGDRDGDKQRLVAMLEDRLNVQRSEESFDDWESLERYRFDPNDVMSDVETLVERQEDTHTKTETREALEWARDESGSWSVNAGWGDISGRLERSFADKDTLVKENLRNVMEQRGINARWEGQRFVPRSVDVISNEQMQSVFRRNLEFRDETVIESGATRKVDLDEYRLYVNSEIAPVLGPPARELSMRLTQVDEDAVALSQSLERLGIEFERISGEQVNLRNEVRAENGLETPLRLLLGRRWVNMNRNERKLSTPYHNDTEVPIDVYVRLRRDRGDDYILDRCGVVFSIGESRDRLMAVGRWSNNGTIRRNQEGLAVRSERRSCSGVVTIPPGSYYLVESSPSSDKKLLSWIELRPDVAE